MNLLRKIAERLSRGKVIKRKIKVDNQHVNILVSPDAQLKYLKMGAVAFDRDLINLAQDHITEADVVWDIGANVGVFTFASAVVSKSGAVLAVEADDWLARLLRRTSRLKDYSNCDIHVLSAAVSNENSVASFLIASRGRASNALKEAGGRSQMGGVRETLHVATLTLDRLLETFPSPQFVKIDIEGAELLALQSAEKVINEVRPKFYIEVGEDVSSQVFEIFKSANYSILDPLTMEQVDECVENTLFIPNQVVA